MVKHMVELEGLEPFDEVRSITLLQARLELAGRRPGEPPSLETLRRWANPEVGCHLLGASGPVLVLPSRKLGGVLRLMPGWVRAFAQARAELGKRGPHDPVRVRPVQARQATRRGRPVPVKLHRA